MTISDKQLAFNLFELTRSEFLSHCRWVAKRIFKEKGHITIDDVRDQVQLPDNIDGRVFGAVFNTPEFKKVGYTSTRRKTSHGRPIAVFSFVSGCEGATHKTALSQPEFGLWPSQA